MEYPIYVFNLYHNSDDSTIDLDPSHVQSITVNVTKEITLNEVSFAKPKNLLRPLTRRPLPYVYVIIYSSVRLPTCICYQLKQRIHGKCSILGADQRLLFMKTVDIAGFGEYSMR